MTAPDKDSRPHAFSVTEFSRRNGIGRTKAYQELSSGRLRGRKVGKRTIITERDESDWLDRLPRTSILGDQATGD